MKILLVGLGFALSTVVGMAQFVLTAGKHTVPSGEHLISFSLENTTGDSITPFGYVFDLIIADVGSAENPRPQFLSYDLQGTLLAEAEFEPQLYVNSNPTGSYIGVYIDDQFGEVPEFPSGSHVLIKLIVSTEGVPAGSYPLEWVTAYISRIEYPQNPPYALDAFDGLLIVPEPASAALLGGLGLLAFAGCRRSRK